MSQWQLFTKLFTGQNAPILIFFIVLAILGMFAPRIIRHFNRKQKPVEDEKNTDEYKHVKVRHRKGQRIWFDFNLMRQEFDFLEKYANPTDATPIDIFAVMNKTRNVLVLLLDAYIRYYDVQFPENMYDKNKKISEVRKIYALYSKGLIDEHTKELADELREYGNRGAHIEQNFYMYDNFGRTAKECFSKASEFYAIFRNCVPESRLGNLPVKATPVNIQQLNRDYQIYSKMSEEGKYRQTAKLSNVTKELRGSSNYLRVLSEERARLNTYYQSGTDLQLIASKFRNILVLVVYYYTCSFQVRYTGWTNEQGVPEALLSSQIQRDNMKSELYYHLEMARVSDAIRVLFALNLIPEQVFKDMLYVRAVGNRGNHLDLMEGPIDANSIHNGYPRLLRILETFDKTVQNW